MTRPEETGFAALRTSGVLSDGVTDSPITISDAVKVFGIFFSQGGLGGGVVIKTADGTTTLMDIELSANSVLAMDISFIADQGLLISSKEITALANFSRVIVYHSHAGT